MSKMIDPATETDPVKVYSSPIPAIVGVFFRQLGLMGASITTLVTLVSQRDIRGLFDYIASHEFIAFLAMAVGLGCLLWGYIRELKVWRKLVTLADEVDDNVGVIVDQVQDFFTRLMWWR